MAGERRVGSLEVGQDLAYQRRAWTLQRVLWVVIALVLVGGLAGAFGSGPLSQAEVRDAGLSLRYDRLARQDAPTELRIAVDPGMATGGEIALWVDRAYLDANQVEFVAPEPTEVETGADRYVYRFAVADPDEAAAIGFGLEPEDVGGTAGRLGIVGGPELAFGQFVFP